MIFILLEVKKKKMTDVVNLFHNYAIKDKITIQGVKDLLTECGVKVPQDKLEALFKQLDTDMDKALNKPEFEQLVELAL